VYGFNTFSASDAEKVIQKASSPSSTVGVSSFNHFVRSSECRWQITCICPEPNFVKECCSVVIVLSFVRYDSLAELLLECRSTSMIASLIERAIRSSAA
jgi:hypothetical protein